MLEYVIWSCCDPRCVESTARLGVCLPLRACRPILGPLKGEYKDSGGGCTPLLAFGQIQWPPWLESHIYSWYALCQYPPPCGGASDWMSLSKWFLEILPLSGCGEGVLGSCHSKGTWRLLGAVATQERVWQMAGATIEHGNDIK